MYITMVSVCSRPAKRRAQNLQGISNLFVVVSFCCLGGGSLDGGDLVSPRCLGPSRPTPEGRGAAHGPRHPAYPLLLRHLILPWGFRLLSSRFLGSAWVFRSEAEILCLLLFALQDPTPVSFVAGVSLSLSLSSLCCLVVLLLAVVAFLFLSSSGAGETQTALRFVVPLVLTWPRSSSSTRTSTTAPTPRRAPAPAVFFLSFSVFVVGVALSLSLSLSLSLFSLSLSF